MKGLILVLVLVLTGVLGCASGGVVKEVACPVVEAEEDYGEIGRIIEEMTPEEMLDAIRVLLEENYGLEILLLKKDLEEIKLIPVPFDKRKKIIVELNRENDELRRCLGAE